MDDLFAAVDSGDAEKLKINRITSKNKEILLNDLEFSRKTTEFPQN